MTVSAAHGHISIKVKLSRENFSKWFFFFARVYQYHPGDPGQSGFSCLSVRHIDDASAEGCRAVVSRRNVPLRILDPLLFRMIKIHSPSGDACKKNCDVFSRGRRTLAGAQCTLHSPGGPEQEEPLLASRLRFPLTWKSIGKKINRH